jgi:hypothetical protein
MTLVHESQGKSLPSTDHGITRVLSQASNMKSRIHPKYKTKYLVSNWREYDRPLVQRGDITLWISEEAIQGWIPASSGKRGAQRKFSDHAIETSLALRLVFKLPLRQAEGFLRSTLSLMGVDLEAPDHTTLSRRSQQLDVNLRHAEAAARGAKVIVPPRKTATRSRRPGARDRAVRRVKEIGRREWKKESGYHQQARVENTFFRYKSIIGDRLRSRHPMSQKAEALIACNILNRVAELGRPQSFAMK